MVVTEVQTNFAFFAIRCGQMFELFFWRRRDQRFVPHHVSILRAAQRGFENHRTKKFIEHEWTDHPFREFLRALLRRESGGDTHIAGDFRGDNPLRRRFNRGGTEEYQHPLWTNFSIPIESHREHKRYVQSRPERARLRRSEWTTDAWITKLCERLSRNIRRDDRIMMTRVESLCERRRHLRRDRAHLFFRKRSFIRREFLTTRTRFNLFPFRDVHNTPHRHHRERYFLRRSYHHTMALPIRATGDGECEEDGNQSQNFFRVLRIHSFGKITA